MNFLPSEIYKFLYYLMGPLHAVQWNGERRVFFIVYLLFILLFTVALRLLNLPICEESKLYVKNGLPVFCTCDSVLIIWNTECFSENL